MKTLSFACFAALREKLAFVFSSYPSCALTSKRGSTRLPRGWTREPEVSDARGSVRGMSYGRAGNANSGMSPVRACMKATMSATSSSGSSRLSISRPMTRIASSSVATCPLLK